MPIADRQTRRQLPASRKGEHRRTALALVDRGSSDRGSAVSLTSNLEIGASDGRPAGRVAVTLRQIELLHSPARESAGARQPQRPRGDNAAQAVR